MLFPLSNSSVLFSRQIRLPICVKFDVHHVNLTPWQTMGCHWRQEGQCIAEPHACCNHIVIPRTILAHITSDLGKVTFPFGLTYVRLLTCSSMWRGKKLLQCVTAATMPPTTTLPPHVATQQNTGYLVSGFPATWLSSCIASNSWQPGHWTPLSVCFTIWPLTSWNFTPTITQPPNTFWLKAAGRSHHVPSGRGHYWSAIQQVIIMIASISGGATRQPSFIFGKPQPAFHLPTARRVLSSRTGLGSISSVTLVHSADIRHGILIGMAYWCRMIAFGVGLTPLFRMNWWCFRAVTHFKIRILWLHLVNDIGTTFCILLLLISEDNLHRRRSYGQVTRLYAEMMEH